MEFPGFTKTKKVVWTVVDVFSISGNGFLGYCEEREGSQDYWLTMGRRFEINIQPWNVMADWISGFRQPFNDKVYWLGLENLHQFTKQVSIFVSTLLFEKRKKGTREKGKNVASIL